MPAAPRHEPKATRTDSPSLVGSGKSSTTFSLSYKRPPLGGLCPMNATFANPQSPIQLQRDGKDGVRLQGCPVRSFPLHEFVCGRCSTPSTVRLRRGSVGLREGILASLANCHGHGHIHIYISFPIILQMYSSNCVSTNTCILYWTCYMFLPLVANHKRP